MTKSFHTYRVSRTTVSLYPLTNNFLIAVTQTRSLAFEVEGEGTFSEEEGEWFLDLIIRGSLDANYLIKSRIGQFILKLWKA